MTWRTYQHHCHHVQIPSVLIQGTAAVVDLSQSADIQVPPYITCVPAQTSSQKYKTNQPHKEKHISLLPSAGTNIQTLPVTGVEEGSNHLPALGGGKRFLDFFVLGKGWLLEMAC